jgi:3',5'-cyclic AMP phosphodiesterase CpdA
MAAFHFVQLSDTHLVRDGDGLVHGVRPYERLDAALAHVARREPRPAFVLLTGDLIHDDEPASYELVRRLTDELEMPVHFVVGNHDVRSAFARILLDDPEGGDEPRYRTFEHEGVRFVLLDSSVPGEVPGHLDAEQLSWLESLLSAAPDAPAVVVVHHPPTNTGVAWLDEHKVDNGDELLTLMAAAPGARHLLFGHVHMPMVVESHGVLCIGAPSTAWQFGDDVNSAQVNAEPGAYRVVAMEAGRLSTWVEVFERAPGGRGES